MLSTANAPANVSPSPGPAEAAPAVREFLAASREHQIRFDDWTSAVIAAVQQSRGPVDVAPFGFAAGILLDVQATGGAGGAAVAHEDGPWSVLQNIQVTDVNGRPIIGPISGYDLFLINKFGGFLGAFNLAPESLPGFTTMDANGNFRFQLLIPHVITPKNGLGALHNFSASATFKLSYDIGTKTQVYATEPAGAEPTVRVRATLMALAQPEPMFGGIANEQTPPYPGTTLAISKAQASIAAGEFRHRFTRMGGLIRQLFVITRIPGGARSATLFPDDYRLELDRQQVEVAQKIHLLNRAAQQTGFALPTGVHLFDYTHDVDGRVGQEDRNLWLDTSQATDLALSGIWGGATTADIITCDVYTPGRS